MPDPQHLVSPLSPEYIPVAVFLLVLVATAGVLYALLQGRLSGQSALRQRLELAGGPDVKTTGSSGAMSEHRRKQSIEKALSDMAQRERSRKRAKLTLPMRLNQAGLSWSVPGFYLRSAVAGAAGTILVHLGVGLDLMLAAPLGAGGGFVAMNGYVRSLRVKRMKKFLEEFPNAIDVVTRGVKTGLPLGDCLKAIANEGQETVREEFRRIVDDISVGLSMAQALTRFTHRVPIMEANFFAVVIAIQSQLGGNLSEALGNLSSVLRERKMMKEKIRAFSSEATASGAIIAAMPVGVGAILSVTSPDYIGLLFSEFAGNVVLAGCALWMAIGVIVMRNMIKFDF